MLDPSLDSYPRDSNAEHGTIGRAVPARRGWSEHLRTAVTRSSSAASHLLGLARPATPAQWVLVAALVVADLAMVAGFVAFAYAEHYGIQSSPFYGDLRFSFVDGSYPELYGYGKQVLIALLLVAAYRLGRQAVYLGLALLFAVAVADDAFAVHEAVGSYLATTAGFPILLAGPLIWGVMGLVPLFAIVAGYRRSDPRGRIDAEAILLGFGILLFFAVGVDLVHGILTERIRGFQTVMTLAEDGGELFSLTLIATMSFGILQRRKPHSASPPRTS